ncbi:uncharacterized protein TM35_000321090 [Trypanosoma theileri]|uniref:Uncharacterized protein n=1 Tax=Trypanosoma theileri TaxID=67003 RepID=A0A1X0NM25_9TRYP|nr:uncharacterized protein TM35_000321090 [Trypanosoma theileri]ORC85794.1 hypothetical protein TM35_000321090 [Trypanosoma theileri]
MSEEFSLLDHLAVSVPEPALTAAERPQQYRVLAPTRRAAEGPQRRQLPKAPFADFTGEVLTVKGKNEAADTEYIIYNSRIPSIQAVNMQLIEEKRKRHVEGNICDKSPNIAFFKSREREYALRRRRLLENLQRINMEQAQRKMEERQREREKRLGRPIMKLKVNSEEPNREVVTTITRNNKSESEAIQSNVLVETDGKKDLDTESEFKGRNELVCSAFPWDNESQRENNRRAESLAIMETNRKLAEDAKKEQEMKKMKEISMELAALEENRAKIEEENARLQEKKRALQRIQRSCSFNTHKENATTRVKDSDTFWDWFPRPKTADENRTREKERKIMETNRKMADEAKRRRIEEEELRIQSERNELREAEELYQKQKERKIIEKRKKQEQFSKDVLNSILEREVRRHALMDETRREDVFFRDIGSKYTKGRQEKEQHYYDCLKKDMESAREARLEARERELEYEKRLLQESEKKAQLDREKKQKRAKQRREFYMRALEEQINAKETKNLLRHIPPPHSGPERKVLYRCPVTGELLPPEQFGIPLSQLQSFRRRFQ